MNEPMLTKYLLGNLPEDEQAQIEEKLFTDDDVFQQVHALKAELSDKYVRGNLTAQEKLQYEKRFLASQTGRADTLFATALTQVLAEEEPQTVRPIVAEPQPGFWESITAFFRVPAFGLGAALACLLLLTVGGLWFYQESRRLHNEVEQANIARAKAEAEARQQQELQTEIARAKTRNEELNQQLQQAQKERDQARKDLEKAGSQSQVSSSTATTLLSFLLVPGLVRGDNNRERITIPLNTGRIQIQLDLDQSDKYQSYRAELRTKSGKLMHRQNNLVSRVTAAGKAVFFLAPANGLRPGDYDVTLQGVLPSGEIEDANFYHFTVARR